MNFGLILLLAGAMVAFISPIERTLLHRRTTRETVILPPLDIAFPISRPDRELEAVAAETDQALEQDALQRGIVAVARTYDAAANR